LPRVMFDRDALCLRAAVSAQAYGALIIPRCPNIRHQLMGPLQPAKGLGIAVNVTHSKQKVFCFVRDLLNDIQAEYIGEQRAYPRHPICVSIEVIPFDSQGHQAGKAFTAVTKDISATGLSFLHDAVILDRYLLVRFPRSDRYPSQWIVLEVLRRRPVGPLWEIAGRSVAE
jgi:hypothetical protein